MRRVLPSSVLPQLTQSQTKTTFDTAPKFAFRGGVADVFSCRDAELLASGPAGTGKTLAILRRLHLCAMKYAGCRILIVRKTRASLTESAMVTYETAVLGPGHPVLSPPNLRRVRQSYRYPNGSEIVVAGMDKPDKVLSSEWDLIYAQEATELNLDDWETLTGRLRNGRMPYQQIIADCNPTTPTHWLYRRYEAGLLKLIPTTHKDNPRFWDATAQQWTADGEQYLSRLNRLTGPRRTRFLEGRWSQAEGLVFDAWDASVHLVNQFIIPKTWTRYMAIDFGYSNPFVCQWYAEDPDGRLYLYREIYKTQTLVEDHAKAIARAVNAWDEKAGKVNWLTANETKPRMIVCDHDAEGRATLERHLGLTTTAADKSVLSGIQEVNERLRPAGDGKPRLFIMRDARIHAPDVSLRDSGKPTCTAEEFEGYCFVAGTMIETATGPIPIEQIATGQMAWTRGGLRTVLRSQKSQTGVKVLTLVLSNGQQVTGTPNHPIFTQNRGWVPLASISSEDIMIAWNHQHQSRFKALCTPDTPTQKLPATGFITEPHRSTEQRGTAGCMWTYGSCISAMSRTDAIFTTKTGTLLTTPLTTCSASALSSTLTRTGATRQEKRQNGPKSSTGLENCRVWRRKQNGIATRLPSVPEFKWQKENTTSLCASIANKSFQQKRSESLGIAAAGVVAITSMPKGCITNEGLASIAAVSSLPTNGSQPETAHVRALHILQNAAVQDVYNLMVDDCHEYFANGLLVHNCWDKDAGDKPGGKEKPVKENDHGADPCRYLCQALTAKKSLKVW